MSRDTEHMSPLPRRVLHALERFHAARPWDHNAHFHPWILRQLPGRVGSALDVGCGTGDLARLLARRAQRVHGVDADPEITARARELTPAAAPVTYTAADADRARWAVVRRHHLRRRRPPAALRPRAQDLP